MMITYIVSFDQSFLLNYFWKNMLLYLGTVKDARFYAVRRL